MQAVTPCDTFGQATAGVRTDGRPAGAIMMT